MALRLEFGNSVFEQMKMSGMKQIKQNSHADPSIS